LSGLFPVDVKPLWSIGQAEMGDPGRSQAGGDWRMILAAIAALALVIGGVAYKYADDLTDLAQSLGSGKLGRAQGHFRY